MRLKIRTKIILSFFTPIIPLTIIVVIVSGYILNNLYNEAQRLDAISKESVKVADLRLSLDKILMPANDYIITGDRKYIEDFKTVSIDLERGLKEVEEILPRMEEIGFDDEVKEEMEILGDVKDAWQNITEITVKIFAIPDPVGNKDAAALMEEMDYKWSYPAIERLKKWGEIDMEEYKNVLERHNMAWRQAGITMTASVISSLVICTIYILIYSRIAARNEEELQASEKRFRDLAEQLPDMVFINKKGRIVYANKKCEEIMKYKREEFYSPDFNFLSLIAPEYIEMIKSNFNKHTRGEDVKPYEYAIITKEGKRVEVISNTVLMDYEGERAILGIITDITERKKAEEKLRQYVDELERFQKVAVKREFRIKELQERVKELEGRQGEGR
jgi:PAS domain S-box-containing protein